MKKIFITLGISILVYSINAQCISGNCETGFGNVKNADVTYSGYFYNNLANGLGIMESATVDNYYGDFLNQQFNGFGAIYTKDNKLQLKSN